MAAFIGGLFFQGLFSIYNQPGLLSVIYSLSLSLLMYLLIPLSVNWRGLWERLSVCFQGKARCCLFLVPVLLLALLSIVVYGRLPFVIDSVSQVFQARVFLDGRFHALVPDHPEFFQVGSTVMTESGWFSQYMPGHILLLVVFGVFGGEWLLNPVFGGILLVLTWMIARSVYNKKTAVVSVLLLLFCPFFHLLQSEAMNHGSCVVWVALATYLTLNFRSFKKQPFVAMVIGLLVGMSFITRPLTTFGLVFPLFLYALFDVFPGVHRKASCVLTSLFGFVVMVLCLCIYNRMLTGGFLLTPYTVANPEMHRLGFTEEFGVIDGLLNSANNFHRMGFYLLAFPLGGYLFLVIYFLFSPLKRHDVLFLLMFLFLGFSYALYSYQDFWFGPRFLYESLFLLVILSARGILFLDSVFRSLLPLGRRHPVRHLFLVSLMVLILGASVKRSIFILTPISHFVDFHCKSLRDSLEPVMSNPNAVVFIPEHKGYMAMLWNQKYPKGPLFPWDLGEKNALLRSRFPRREFFVLDDKGLTLLPPNKAPDSGID
jgi:dolichyl-phosphate-mannose-protein mannosyltransferase